MKQTTIWPWGWLLVSLASCASLPVSSNFLSDAPLPLRTGWVHSRASLHSWKALRESNVVMQQYDYSCGAGALATLLRHYFQDPVEEKDVLLAILSRMSPEEIRDREQNGLSLLDLKRYAEQRGYLAVGVKLKLAALPALKGPILVHLEQEDYKHFAVCKGIRGDRVYLADPSRGNIRMSVDRFLREWSGMALILGKVGFGLPPNHPLTPEFHDPFPNELFEARKALFLR